MLEAQLGERDAVQGRAVGLRGACEGVGGGGGLCGRFTDVRIAYTGVRRGGEEVVGRWERWCVDEMRYQEGGRK